MHTLIQALILATLAVISNQSQAELAPISDTNHYAWVAQTATPGGRVRVTITKIKPKLHLVRSQQSIARLLVNGQDDDYYDDLPDIQVGYRRPELFDQSAEVHHTISDEIKLRLILARKKALEKYQETWG